MPTGRSEYKSILIQSLEGMHVCFLRFVHASVQRFLTFCRNLLAVVSVDLKEKCRMGAYEILRRFYSCRNLENYFCFVATVAGRQTYVPSLIYEVTGFASQEFLLLTISCRICF